MAKRKKYQTGGKVKKMDRSPQAVKNAKEVKKAKAKSAIKSFLEKAKSKKIFTSRFKKK